MTAIRTIVAAAALAIVGAGAGTANAAIVKKNVIVNPNARLHLCIPHTERKVVVRHHTRYLVIYRVDRLCHRHVVRVIRLGRAFTAR
ncbi:MAG: hypothetical protein KIT16_08600 [Rhodospirillaceae bacterium]|nr:hypothetical protein [Rhodospirillaceae bacterium]